MSRYGESFRMIVKWPCVPMHDFTNDDASLELLQIIVGGDVELIRIPELNIALIDVFVNMDGRDKGLDPNLQVGEMLLVGPVIFLGSGESGESISLTQAQVELIDSWLNNVLHARRRDAEADRG